MKRLHQTLGAFVLGTMLTTTGASALAQDTTLFALQDEESADVGIRAQLAAITLDNSALPDGYSFAGETFLTAGLVASGDIDAETLTDAGFETQYLSVYENEDDGSRIRTYASAWTDAEAAQAGFDLLEDESLTNPDADLADSDAAIGEEPRETTTGSYPDPAGDGESISVVDVTFRVDRLLVGVAVETTGDAQPDAETASALAETLATRASAVLNGESPEGIDLSLPGNVLSLEILGIEVQTGFLSPAEVEELYGLQGSVLDSFSASWVQSIGTGNEDGLQPYLTVGTTVFENEDDASAVVKQATDLTPTLPELETIEDASVEGADSAIAFRFASPATGGETVDSYRIIFTIGAAVSVVDVQGESSPEDAEETAAALAASQVSCQSEGNCDIIEFSTE